MRLEYWKVAPDAFKALAGVSAYLGKSTIDAATRALIELRVSQINGCAYCVDLHAHEARAAGIAQQKLDCLAVWREAGAVFADRERAALDWAERITTITPAGVPDDVYARVAEHFPPRELVDLTTTIATMNAWNRIAVGFERAPQAR